MLASRPVRRNGKQQACLAHKTQMHKAIACGTLSAEQCTDYCSWPQEEYYSWPQEEYYSWPPEECPMPVTEAEGMLPQQALHRERTPTSGWCESRCTRSCKVRAEGAACLQHRAAQCRPAAGRPAACLVHHTPWAAGSCRQAAAGSCRQAAAGTAADHHTAPAAAQESGSSRWPAGRPGAGTLLRADSAAPSAGSADKSTPPPQSG